MEFLELIFAAFINIIAPVIGTIAGVLGLILLTKVMKSMGLTVSQKQMDALGIAADKATKSVETWAAKKVAEGGTKPATQAKTEKAVAMVKTFLSDQKLYDVAEDKISAAIEAKLGENAIGLADIVDVIQAKKKASVGN